MNRDDRICQEDLDATLAVVERMHRRSMIAAILGSLLFAAFCGAVMYFLRSDHHMGAALSVAALTWLFIGLPLAVYWQRHYKFIFRQLSQVEKQVQSGEIIYGSQVSFHRHSA